MEVLRKRNTATTIYFPMIKVGVQDFAQGGDWTPVAADTKYSVDGGAFANTTNVPTHEGQGFWSLALVAGEVNGMVTAIAVVDAATKAVEDQALLVATYGDSSASIEVLPADIKQWLTVAPNALVSGRPDVSVGAMAANVLTAAAGNSHHEGNTSSGSITNSGYFIYPEFPPSSGPSSILNEGDNEQNDQ